MCLCKKKKNHILAFTVNVFSVRYVAVSYAYLIVLYGCFNVNVIYLKADLNVWITMICSKETRCLSHGWQFYGRIMEGFFILSWKVFDLVGNCSVSDNVHGKQRLTLACSVSRHQKEDKHTAVVGFGSFIYSFWIYKFFFFY